MTRRRLLYVFGLGTAGALLAACQSAPSSAPTAAPAKPTAAPAAPTTAPAAKPAEPAKPAATTAAVAAPAAAAKAPDARWNELVAAAKQEGKVVLVGPPSPEMRTELPSLFKERFDIEVEYIGGPTPGNLMRIRNERAAGIYSADVLYGGETPLYTGFYPEKMLDPILPILVNPDAVDTSKWPNGQLPFADPEQQYILPLALQTPLLLSANTSSVKPGDVTSWNDLLKPQFTGKIASDDPSRPSAGGNAAIFLYLLMGEDYVKRLYVDQQVVFSQDARQMADWLARGTHSLAIGLGEAELKVAADEGFPVAAVPNPQADRAYVTSSPGSLVLMNKAPHPNAAQLLVNWLAMKEGQEHFSRIMDIPPIRLDADKSRWDAAEIPDPKLNSINFSEWNFATKDLQEAREKMLAIVNTR